MTVDYRHRQYQDGDAAAINDLYAAVTGRSRSIRQFEWQWLESPGGKGDIWLIEAIRDDGATILIGHHGIMPIRFSRGKEDLLFGKTENTMVRSEYRNKILYPRFERRFAQVYEERFEALFSTFGPAPAIRQRSAMGYSFPSRWVKLRIPTSWAGHFLFIFRVILNRFGAKGRKSCEPVHRTQSNMSATSDASPLKLRVLDDAQARIDPFFDSFWPNCRLHYGLTPRRDRKDLDWRFWSNPNRSHITLVSDSDASELGYVVLKVNGSSPDAASIEDIVPSAPSSIKYGRLLDSALVWLRINGFKWVDLSTTSDSCGAGKIAAGIKRRNLLLLQATAMFRSDSGDLMPRKITASGRRKSVSLDNWYVTPIVFEGI